MRFVLDLSGILVLLTLLVTCGLGGVAVAVVLAAMGWVRWRHGRWSGRALRQLPGALAATALSLFALGVMALVTDSGTPPDVRAVLRALEDAWPLSLLAWLLLLALAWWAGWRACVARWPRRGDAARLGR